LTIFFMFSIDPGSEKKINLPLNQLGKDRRTGTKVSF